FVDDSADNIRDMNVNRPDVVSVLVEGADGMEDQEWGHIWDALDGWGIGH
ncbi:hypothetical protein TrRE_jg2129, partial [Triparma retinervis]